MIITNQIKDDDFTFCPKCGTLLGKRETYRGKYYSDNYDYKECPNCYRRYHLGLEPSMG